MCGFQVRTVFYILAREVLMMIPAGGEYPNVKCENRSPCVSVDIGACIVNDNGDVHILQHVDWNSGGRYIFTLKEVDISLSGHN